VSKDTDDEEDEDEDDADESGSIKETELKSGDNTRSEADQVTTDLEKLTVDETGTPTSDKVVGEADTNGVDNQKGLTAAD
jgi:hypothetical protein